MQKGLLHIAGTIRTEQFWPDGESDADTIKVYVGEGEHAFQFRSSPFVDFKPTNVFRTTEVQELHYNNKQYTGIQQNFAVFFITIYCLADETYNIIFTIKPLTLIDESKW